MSWTHWQEITAYDFGYGLQFNTEEKKIISNFDNVIVCSGIEKPEIENLNRLKVACRFRNHKHKEIYQVEILRYSEAQVYTSLEQRIELCEALIEEFYKVYPRFYGGMGDERRLEQYRFVEKWAAENKVTLHGKYFYIALSEKDAVNMANQCSIYNYILT